MGLHIHFYEGLSVMLLIQQPIGYWIMARAEEEVEEISSKSNALALNLGVPESTTAHSMILAGEAAMKKNSYRI